MSRIKSAWEIALEKTADIEIDEKKYKEDSLTKEGMSLAGRYINDPQVTIEEVSAKMDSFSGMDKNLVRKGIKQVVVSNVNLPTDDAYEFRFSRISDLACLLNKQAAGVMDQVTSFFGQYLTAKEEFVKRMREQITQMMKDNPEQTNSAQYTKLIEQNLKKMEDQYSQALGGSIATLEEIL